jgi:hypothetical protein
LPECSISAQVSDEPALADVLSDCVSGHERFWVIIRGTPEVVKRMKSFFLDPNDREFHLEKTQELVQVSVYLFDGEQ